MGRATRLFNRIFKRKRFSESIWSEFGRYNAIFSPFGDDMWRSDLVRSCVRPISEHTSKAHAVSSDARIAKLLNSAPNRFMNGKDFLAKIRIWLEIKNTAYVFINRDEKGKVSELYPVPYSTFQAIESNGKLFMQFTFYNNTAEKLTAAWEDIAVLRKDYYTNDIWGDDNRCLLDKLGLIATINQGVGNAVKATANLRGILKSTKAMLSDDDIRKAKDNFVKDYLNLENSGGIASLDATQDFTPITMNPTVIDSETMKQFREDLYRYFGVNDKILMASYDEEVMEAFYQSRIEPFLIAFSEELTRKVFRKSERDLGAYIIYEGDRLRYISNTNKLKMTALVDRAIMTPNEVRAMFNLSPYEGGDEFQRRLDTATTGNQKGDNKNGSDTED